MPTIKLSIVFLALGALVACETFQGAGRDISNTGRTITSEARQVQSDM